MRMYAECVPCILSVRYREIEKLFHDEEKRMEILGKVLEMLHRLVYVENLRVSPIVATHIFRFLKKVSNNEDPYREEKRVANRVALEIYQELRNTVLSRDPIEALPLSLAISALGNALDLGVAGYEPPNPRSLIEKGFEVARDPSFVEAARVLARCRRVVVVMDNAGEAVLDRLVADVLRKLGIETFAVVKSGAFQNDATVWEVKEMGLEESFDHVLGSGTDAASIFLEEISEEVRRLVTVESDAVVLKGMANYEYVTEIQNVVRGRKIYVLMAKCRPIAKNLGVDRGRVVAYLA